MSIPHAQLHTAYVHGTNNKANAPCKSDVLFVFLVSTRNNRDDDKGNNLKHRRLERPVADGAVKNLQFNLDGGGRHPPCCPAPAATVVFLLQPSSLYLLLRLHLVLHTCLISEIEENQSRQNIHCSLMHLSDRVHNLWTTPIGLH